MSWTCRNCFCSQAILPTPCITREQILQKSFLSLLPTIRFWKLIGRYKATWQMKIVYLYICKLYIWDNSLFVIHPKVCISWRSRCKHRKISQLKWEAARVRAAWGQAGFRDGDESSCTHRKRDWVCWISKRHKVNWKQVWKWNPRTTKWPRFWRVYFISILDTLTLNSILKATFFFFNYSLLKLIFFPHPLGIHCRRSRNTYIKVWMIQDVDMKGKAKYRSCFH